MSDIAIRVENLSKAYQITRTQGEKKYHTLQEDLVALVRRPFRRGANGSTRETVWALKDVSFEVKHGEVVGIIGRNGAGKSTLLKILSRITEPTKGYADVYGRVGSLLEVGTGFHPELTGRENIFLNGAILGMTRQEIQHKFDEIVAFAEVEQYIDTPVKRYSSGMYVRLAFAVAAHLEPEILIVDEVLAVGDAAFQKKCLGKMGDVAREGRTVLFVSHNMAAVQSLCSRACLLDRGRIVASGQASSVIAEYLQTVGVSRPLDLASRTDRQGNGKLRLLAFSAYGADPQLPVTYGDPAHLEVTYEGQPPLRNVNLAVGVYTLLGEAVLYLSTDLVGATFEQLPARGKIICRFEKLPLAAGTYVLHLYCTVNGVLADWVTEAARIDVAEGDFFGTGRTPPQGYGVISVDHDWTAQVA